MQAATSREIVYQSLHFQSPPRVPRDLWVLPWADTHIPQALAELRRRFPSDFVHAPNVYRPSSRRSGDMYGIGTYVDEWGCVFENLQAGVIGEVKTPQVAEWSDLSRVQPPLEILPQPEQAALEQVKRFCGEEDRFVLGGCCPRPWERYQFIRGTANALMDVMFPEEGMDKLLPLIHNYYLRELEFWVRTDVDGIMFMDDWGSQQQLLISPALWREHFKPLYRDYCDLIHAHGKCAFMHSDGQILDVYPDLIEIGVNAVNSQLFCMDMEKLAAIAKGKITFWGEIDRQHVIPSTNPRDGRDAVEKVARLLYAPEGGVIAQFELTPGACPETAIAIFEQWAEVDKRQMHNATS